MSTSILPDDSVVVRLSRQTVHVDARGRAIHIRASYAQKELGGSLLASFPMSAADRVRLHRGDGGRFRLFLDLKSAAPIELGDAPSQDVAMMTARVIADLTRCKIEVRGGEVEVRRTGAASVDPELPPEAPTIGRRELPFDATRRLPYGPRGPSLANPLASGTNDPPTDPGEEAPTPAEPRSVRDILDRGVLTEPPAGPSPPRAFSRTRAFSSHVPPPRPITNDSTLVDPPSILEAPSVAQIEETFDARDTSPSVVEAATDPDNADPSGVFMQLILESQLAAAEPLGPEVPIGDGSEAPSVPDAPAPFDANATLVGVSHYAPPDPRAGFRGQTALDALYELLRLASQRLPLARPEDALAWGPRR